MRFACKKSLSQYSFRPFSHFVCKYILRSKGVRNQESEEWVSDVGRLNQPYKIPTEKDKSWIIQDWRTCTPYVTKDIESEHFSIDILVSREYHNHIIISKFSHSHIRIYIILLHFDKHVKKVYAKEFLSKQRNFGILN